MARSATCCSASTADDLDFDLTTDARPPRSRRCLDGWAQAIWEQGERFGTIGANRRSADGPERTFEITTFRSEAYLDDSRKPQVTFSESHRGRSRPPRLHDQRHGPQRHRRPDGAHPVLVDPFGGAADLARRILRTPLAPQISFGDDPLRMLRAARFIARFGLEPDPALVDAVVDRVRSASRSCRPSASATSSTS